MTSREEPAQSDRPATDKKKAYAAPTLLAGRFVRYVVGFGVAIGVGTAAFLGKIPGLEALAMLFPGELRSFLLPVSTFLMGFIAVVVQFYSGEVIHRTALRKRFKISSACLIAGFVVFVVLVPLVIVDVPYKQSKYSKSFVVGLWRPPACCPDAQSARRCIEERGLDPGSVEECWGGWRILLSKSLLSVSYLFLTGGFAGLIGLLLLQEEARKKKPRRVPKSAPPTESTG